MFENDYINGLYRTFNAQLTKLPVKCDIPALSASIQQNLTSFNPKLVEIMRQNESKAPMMPNTDVNLDQDIVTIGAQGNWDAESESEITQYLKLLSPWRKGPFQVGPVKIESEWQSNLKWDRLNPPDLSGKRVLDVGCGNGYYLFRMAAQTPRWVLGADPYSLYYFQFKMLQHWANVPKVDFLPLKLADLAPFNGQFDVVFCLGVINHLRSPIDALRQLRDLLRPGGVLVLEGLIFPGTDSVALYPEETYQSMPNIHFVPTLPCLKNWIKRARLIDPECVDISATTLKEQRDTDWVGRHSLENFLNPSDPTQTAEGYPAPQRAVVHAFKKK